MVFFVLCRVFPLFIDYDNLTQSNCVQLTTSSVRLCLPTELSGDYNMDMTDGDMTDGAHTE